MSLVLAVATVIVVVAVVLASFRAGVVLAAGLPYPSSRWLQVRLNGLPFSCDLMR